MSIYKLTETKPGEYEGVCLNPKDIPPDDLDDVILGRVINEQGIFYKKELEGVRGNKYPVLAKAESGFLLPNFTADLINNLQEGGKRVANIAI
jgi:hypothetical protein